MEILLITFAAEHIYLEYSACGLYYLKSYVDKDPSLKDIKISVKYYNNRVPSDILEEQKKEIIGFIKERRVDIIGFGCYIWNIKRVLSLSCEIKEIFPSVKIILGGPQVIYRPEELLREKLYLDIIVRGDGEETFAELLRYFLYGYKTLHEITGITFRVNNEIISTTHRALLMDLDSIPSVYLGGLYSIRKGCVYPVETSRGCIFKCAYCHWGMTKLRFFSLERVKKELLYLLDKKVSFCMFVDSAINFDKERALHIINFINKNNKGTLVTMFQSIHFMDEELINVLNASPGIYTEIGVQSLNPIAMRNINRKVITKEEFARLSFMMRPFTIDLIYGLPGDNLQFFKETFQEVFRYTKNISMFRLGVHPGTDLWEKRDEYSMEIDEEYSIICNYSYGRSDIEETEIFKKNYEEVFSPIVCSEFSGKEIWGIADSLRLSICDFINEYSRYLKENFSSEYINNIKYTHREIKLQSLREFSIMNGGGVI